MCHLVKVRASLSLCQACPDAAFDNAIYAKFSAFANGGWACESTARKSIVSPNKILTKILWIC